MAVLQVALQVATFAGVGSCGRRRCSGRAHAVTTHQTPSASAISPSVCVSAVMTPALRVSRALLPARSVIRSQCPNNRLRYFTFALPFHARHMANESLHIHSTAPHLRRCVDLHDLAPSRFLFLNHEAAHTTKHQGLQYGRSEERFRLRGEL